MFCTGNRRDEANTANDQVSHQGAVRSDKTQSNLNRESLNWRIIDLTADWSYEGFTSKESSYMNTKFKEQPLHKGLKYRSKEGAP